MIQMPRRCYWSICLFLILCARVDGGPDDTKTLQEVPQPGAKTSSKEAYLLDWASALGKSSFQLAIPTNGLLAIGIIKTQPTNVTTTVSLIVGGFYGEQRGQSLAIQPSQTNIVFSPGQSFATVNLLAGSSPRDTYHGTLVVNADGIAPLIWRGSLMQTDKSLPRSATLVSDSNILDVYVTRRFFGLSKDDAFPQSTITIHDKTGDFVIEGIGLRYHGTISPAHGTFDIDRNISFFLDTTNIVPTLAQSVSSVDAQIRSIPVGGQKKLGIAFHGLEPGQYTVELGLHASNSQPDQSQNLKINLKVSDNVWPAVFFLLASLLLSFFCNKWLKLYRRRLELQKRISSLRPDWLAEQPPTYTVVWVNTALRQAEQLNRKLLLVSPEMITQRLDKVPLILTTLSEARSARMALTGLPPLVRNRFEAVIGDSIRSIWQGGIDTAKIEAVKAALTALREELTGNRWADRYWEVVQRTTSQFLAGFDPAQASAPSQQLVTKAMNILRPANSVPAKPATSAEMISYEETYAKLMLIHMRRENPEATDLIASYDKPLEQVFKIADDAAWKRIAKAQLTIEPPIRGAGTPCEAFQPLLFAVKTNTVGLDETYLFNRGLKFEWHFLLKEGKQATRLQSITTFSPRVVHFVAGAGDLNVSVRITPQERDDKKVLEANEIIVPILKSSELGLLRNFERTEWWSLAFAALFALISGLLTFYYKNPVFGTAQDYLTLILWGVGVDQGKSFLQSLQSPPQDAKSLGASGSELSPAY